MATSRAAQPTWFRVVKWTVILGAAVRFWDAPFFWHVVTALTGLALGLHLLWRSKTRCWTQPWLGWNDLEAARRVAKK